MKQLAIIVAALVGIAAVFLIYPQRQRDGAAVSPTAHYTGYVWVRNGMSDHRLLTKRGKLLFHLLEPFMASSRWRSGPTVEEFLLARHQLIDFQLERLIEDGKISQIVEIAAGLSPRGLRFRQKYGDKILYIEADLPDMVTLKQNLIGSSFCKHHKMVEVNVLSENSPESLKSVCLSLNRTQGTAIVSEGLLNYYDEATVRKIWRSIADSLSLFPYGMYVSDIHINQNENLFSVSSFKWMLSIFVRGEVHLLFSDRLAAEWALIDSGFLSALVHRTEDWVDDIQSCGTMGARSVHLITAMINPK